MCLLIFAHRVSPSTPLVVAANRDEFYGRPTAASQFWPEHPDLLAGRDLEQGGTWMGITHQGRFAAITNSRDPARTLPAPRSRGELPLSYLASNREPEQFLSELAATADDYAGFNLLLGDGNDLWYVTNSSPQSQCTPQRLQPGIYGLSNARLNTPWPKVNLGKEKLGRLLELEQALEHEQLLEVVADRTLAEPTALKQQGLGSEMDQVLSAQFIVTQRYGTRSSTTLWMHSDGRGSWRELSFDQQGHTREVSEQSFGP